MSKGFAITALIFGLVTTKSAQAEGEVRIALSSNTKSIVISGLNLSVFDGVIGERLATAVGEANISLRVSNARVRISTKNLKYDKKAKRESKKLIFESNDGVRVDGTLYLGRISAEVRKGRLLVINRIPVETYLLGIVGSEMNPLWPSDALKAQAVAARTYAMQRRMIMRYANRPYDLESTVLSQVYKGAERISQSVIDAVSLTRGEVLSHNHRLVEALFHSTCGGQTNSAREAFGNHVSYLVPKKCKWCRPSPRYRWETQLSLKDLESSLQKAKLIRGKLTEIYRKNGQMKTTAFTRNKKFFLSSRSLRTASGYSKVFSSKFSAKTRGAYVHFSGRGFGHGVGMCQWGAKGLADAGYNYLEILAHYYSGSGVHRVY